MDKSLIIEKEIVIEASPDDVWFALTDKESIKKYFFGTEAISDWKVGSSLIFQGEWEGQTYQDKGNILESEPGKMLKYNYWTAWSGLDDAPENYSIVSYSLSSSGNQTSLELKQEGFANQEAYDHGQGGWDAVLDNLKKLLEGKL
jgi:uncharacterized protein YndB with AHSA1/START domain